MATMFQKACYNQVSNVIKTKSLRQTRFHGKKPSHSGSLIFQIFVGLSTPGYRVQRFFTAFKSPVK